MFIRHVGMLYNLIITSGHELTKGKLTTGGYLAHAQGASTNQNTTTTGYSITLTCLNKGKGYSITLTCLNKGKGYSITLTSLNKGKGYSITLTCLNKGKGSTC